MLKSIIAGAATFFVLTAVKALFGLFIGLVTAAVVIGGAVLLIQHGDKISGKAVSRI